MTWPAAVDLTRLSVFADAGNVFLIGEIKMKHLRRLFPGLVLGLTIAISGAGFAQQAAQSADNKNESGCCASCDCCSDSCAMMKKDAMKNHAISSLKHECCGGDSCETKDGAMKNRAASARHECCGDSGAKKTETMKDKSASGKHESCCDDSCHKSEAKRTTAAMKDGAQACCCGGDSCKMENMKDKRAR
jgi:hypothetical protein